jgi:hypothetical protein
VDALVASSSAVALPERSALRLLPRRQAAWVAAQVGVAAVLAVSGIWQSHPELSIALSLAAGPVAANPRRWWALPLVGAGVALAGLGFKELGYAPILASGAVAGAFAVWLLPETTDWIDLVNGALGTMAGAALGLFAAVGLVPDVTGTVMGATLTAALVGLVASQGLLPVAIRFDQNKLPSRRLVTKTLRAAYRSPVFKAFDLYTTANRVSPDNQTRRGLAEVARWVYRLQLTLQQLDDELTAIDPVQIGERIASAENNNATDEFTQERLQATAAHLHRLLDHRRAIAVERRRTDALVEYSMAFLEEARASLAVARELPGEAIPDRIPEVLHRLRSASEEGDARRKTVREMGAMQV